MKINFIIIVLLILPLVNANCEDFKYEVNKIGKNETTSCYENLEFRILKSNCQGYCFTKFEKMSFFIDDVEIWNLTDTSHLASPFRILKKTPFDCSVQTPKKFTAMLEGDETCVLEFFFDEEYKLYLDKVKDSDNGDTNPPKSPDGGMGDDMSTPNTEDNNEIPSTVNPSNPSSADGSSDVYTEVSTTKGASLKAPAYASASKSSSSSFPIMKIALGILGIIVVLVFGFVTYYVLSPDKKGKKKRRKNKNNRRKKQ